MLHTVTSGLFGRAFGFTEKTKMVFRTLSPLALFPRIALSLMRPISSYAILAFPLDVMEQVK
jgi:hypothetical protein